MRQHMDNAAISKLKGNVPLTVEDVQDLEKILWNEVGTKQDYEAEYGQKPLGGVRPRNRRTGYERRQRSLCTVSE